MWNNEHYVKAYKAALYALRADHPARSLDAAQEAIACATPDYAFYAAHAAHDAWHAFQAERAEVAA